MYLLGHCVCIYWDTLYRYFLGHRIGIYWDTLHVYLLGHCVCIYWDTLYRYFLGCRVWWIEPEAAAAAGTKNVHKLFLSIHNLFL